MGKSSKYFSPVIIYLFVGVLISSCKSDISNNTIHTGTIPVIEPDYIGVTIPPNIAPMNFVINENSKNYRIIVSSENSVKKIDLKSRDGIVQFPAKAWKRMLEASKGDKISIQIFSSSKVKRNLNEFEPFYMHVSADPIDPYLAYRLIHPGYYSWSNIRIMQRSLENFREESLFENQVMEKNCANCHSFNSNRSDRFMIHVRGTLGGTYFVEDGKITRTDPKIDAMPGGATYPSWHPGGRFLAYSSNQVRQSFYSVPEKSIEVFDLVSSLILYDRQSNEILNITDRDTTQYLQTFPSWSPDGRYLYYCVARQVINSADPELGQIMNTHYDLARKSFDPETRLFGDAELVFNASDINKSVSFPRISPDGRYLVFTLADYGTFPIWHKEADLYLLDLQNSSYEKMNINSSETESYHTWSLNGRWMVFSSKRIDGRSARPHFVHIGPDGVQGKEFVLPQKDPALYSRMLESFNIPEFVNGKIMIKPVDFAKASKQEALKAKAGIEPDAAPAHEVPIIKLKENERSIHE